VQVERFVEHVQHVNPRAQVFLLSASSGEGLEAWHQWLLEQVQERRTATEPATESAAEPATEPATHPTTQAINNIPFPSLVTR
jgi:hypothetical protein